MKRGEGPHSLPRQELHSGSFHTSDMETHLAFLGAFHLLSENGRFTGCQTRSSRWTVTLPRAFTTRSRTASIGSGNSGGGGSGPRSSSFFQSWYLNCRRPEACGPRLMSSGCHRCRGVIERPARNHVGNANAVCNHQAPKPRSFSWFFHQQRGADGRCIISPPAPLIEERDLHPSDKNLHASLPD